MKLFSVEQAKETNLAQHYHKIRVNHGLEEKLREERDKLKNEIAQVETTRTNINNALLAYTKEHQDKKVDLEKQLNQIEREIARKSHYLIKREQEIEETKARLENKETELDAQRKNLESKEIRLSDQEQKVNQKEQQISVITSKTEDKHREVDQKLVDLKRKIDILGLEENKLNKKKVELSKREESIEIQEKDLKNREKAILKQLESLELQRKDNEKQLKLIDSRRKQLLAHERKTR